MQDSNERAVMCCPLNGKLCKSGRREDFHKDETGTPIQCRWWTHLYGKDPQSDKVIDQWDCAMAWLPVTSTEGAQMTRQMTATLDAHRDEMSKNFGRVADAVSNGLAQVAARPIHVVETAAPTAQIENGAKP